MRHDKPAIALENAVTSKIKLGDAVTICIIGGNVSIQKRHMKAPVGVYLLRLAEEGLSQIGISDLFVYKRLK